MIAAAPHRALDGVGTWHASGAALAKLHRLVLPGQTTAAQPSVERDGPHVGVFDGRLDAASRDDDGAAAVGLVARRGADAVEELHGDFAFAVWNQQTRTLVAGRDRLGIRPLHWAIDGSRLLVASDVAQILAAM